MKYSKLQDRYLNIPVLKFAIIKLKNGIIFYKSVTFERK